MVVDRWVKSVKPAPLHGVDGTECYGCGMGWIRLVVAVVSAILFCSHLVSVSWIIAHVGLHRIVKPVLRYVLELLKGNMLWILWYVHVQLIACYKILY